MGGSSAIVVFVLAIFLRLLVVPISGMVYPNGNWSRLHTRGKHTPRPVALTGAPGGAAQNMVSTHSEMSLCVVGLSLVFFGEQGMGLPDLVRGTPAGSTSHLAKGMGVEVAARVWTGGGWPLRVVGCWGVDSVPGSRFGMAGEREGRVEGRLGIGSERKVDVSGSWAWAWVAAKELIRMKTHVFMLMRGAVVI